MKFLLVCVVLSYGVYHATATPQLFGRGGGGGSGDYVGVTCRTERSSDGRYKVNCAGADPNRIALRSEHILWLQGPSGQGQVVDIEVPNYKIEELIKAGFKTSVVSGPKINVLLRKPEQVYDAQVDQPKSVAGAPDVELRYEPVTKTVVHFPNDKAYSPLTGPILPPLKQYQEDQQRSFDGQGVLDPRLGRRNTFS